MELSQEESVRLYSNYFGEPTIIKDGELVFVAVSRKLKHIMPVVESHRPEVIAHVMANGGEAEELMAKVEAECFKLGYARRVPVVKLAKLLAADV